MKSVRAKAADGCYLQALFYVCEKIFKLFVTSVIKKAFIRVRGQKPLGLTLAKPDERNFLTMEDEQIVELYIKRDQRAIRGTQQKFGKRIINISKNITGSDLTAEEVENDTYLRAWESIPPTEPRTYLFAFLARIARNLSISVLRERSAQKRNVMLVELSNEMEECLPSSSSVEDDTDGNLLLELINKFLFEKDETKRDLFMRRYWYLDSVKTLSKRFGMSESSVKTTLCRMRAELREYLAANDINV